MIPGAAPRRGRSTSLGVLRPRTTPPAVLLWMIEGGDLTVRNGMSGVPGRVLAAAPTRFQGVTNSSISSLDNTSSAQAT